MPNLNFADVRLNYDPSAPQQRFREAGLEAAFASPSAQLPNPPTWPADGVPKPIILTPAPNESDDLSRFQGYDVVVVTWTAAEGAALAALMTPANPTSTWFEYRHNIASYVPLVTGPKAPFNDSTVEMKRYFHSLGLYFPVQIGSAKVLLFKSGLHLAYDGPATPVKKLMAEIASAVKPKLFITTGTGGGIGTDVLLSDVVVGRTVRFDCTGQFKNQAFHNQTFTASTPPAGAFAAATPELLTFNSTRVPNSRSVPKIWSAATDTIVTTDVFAFDDSTDHFKLQGLGQMCEMGDAMVADAVQGVTGMSFYAIRNVSDPQIPNPNNDLNAAENQAGQIYAKYGGLTTASSVIATWSLIYSDMKSGAAHH